MATWAWYVLPDGRIVDDDNPSRIRKVWRTGGDAEDPITVPATFIGYHNVPYHPSFELFINDPDGGAAPEGGPFPPTPPPVPGDEDPRRYGGPGGSLGVDPISGRVVVVPDPSFWGELILPPVLPWTPLPVEAGELSPEDSPVEDIGPGADVPWTSRRQVFIGGDLGHLRPSKDQAAHITARISGIKWGNLGLPLIVWPDGMSPGGLGFVGNEDLKPRS